MYTATVHFPRQEDVMSKFAAYVREGAAACEDVTEGWRWLVAVGGDEEKSEGGAGSFILNAYNLPRLVARFRRV